MDNLVLNEFYSIAALRENDKDSLQLNNLGTEKIAFAIGGRYGITNHYSPVTKEDYDKNFAYRITKIKPIYEMDKFLDFHFNYYVNEKDSSREKFMMHMEYVILPRLESAGEVCVKLFKKWLETKGITSETKIPTTVNQFINNGANSAFQVQQNSNNSSQQQHTNYAGDNEKLSEFLTLLKSELRALNAEQQQEFEEEIKYAERQLSKGNDIKTQMADIASLMKEIGMGVFTNIVSSPLYSIIQPYLGI